MGKIVLLVSREEMLHQAHNILQEKKFRIQDMRVIQTDQAVIEARRSIADGASIIIARGLQASLIKQNTDIPVAEITMTAQEMALLVMRAKQIAGKSRPTIAVVGFPNMFCDMSFFDELYGIELRTYYADQGDGLSEAASRAVEDGVDVIIGGDTAVSAAREAEVPSLFLSMTEDSMRQAFFMAENMEYAMNAEKKTAAQIETLLDYSFNGVIRLDGDGAVAAVNPLMEDIIGRKQAELRGRNIREIAPMIGEEAFHHVFGEGKDCSLFLEWNHTPLLAVAAPVLIDGRVDGAIITCHKAKRKTASVEGNDRRSCGAGRKSGSHPLPPLIRFEDILQKSRAMQECVRLAGLFALSQHPVVLWGEPGTEKRMMAESIHNSSRRGNGPFLELSCRGLSEEEQRNLIFGDRGAALQAEGGTLLLGDVEELTPGNQFRLCRLIRFRVCHGTDLSRPGKADVRVMATADGPLARLMNRGKITPELYYLLSGLELSIPPLRERKEDLRQKIEDGLRGCCERYSRYHVLTDGAKNLLILYPWPGNLYQIDSFFERLILTAGKRSIDEIAVKNLFKELYPKHLEPGGEDSGFGPEGDDSNGIKRKTMGDIGGKTGYAAEEAARIAGVLRRLGGSREKTARELGISKSTLWRRMKKYGIEMD